jgi:hypothetical protein
MDTAQSTIATRDLSRTEIVPHVHFSAQRAHFNDSLTQEVVRLSRELLTQFALQIIVFIPHSHFDSIGGVMAFAEEKE